VIVGVDVGALLIVDPVPITLVLVTIPFVVLALLVVGRSPEKEKEEEGCQANTIFIVLLSDVV